MANEKRLVNAEAIARKLKNRYCAECNVVRKVQCSACWVDDVLELLEGDVVDAVEVVRCKKCKQWNCVKKPKGYDKLLGYCLNDDEPIERWEYDFCSYGERKE